MRGRRGLMTSLTICVSSDCSKIRGSRAISCSIKARTSGNARAIWYAMVGTRYLAQFRRGSDLEKKKLARRRLASWQSSAILCAIADFPHPAGPWSHMMKLSVLSFPRTQFIILSVTASLVLGGHHEMSVQRPCSVRASVQSPCIFHQVRATSVQTSVRSPCRVYTVETYGLPVSN